MSRQPSTNDPSELLMSVAIVVLGGIAALQVWQLILAVVRFFSH